MLRHFTHKHKTNHTHATAKTFAYLEFFKSFSIASFYTVFPIILYEKIGTEDLVGYYNSMIAAVGLLTCILSSYIFCKFSKVNITKISLALSVVCLVLMTLATNLWSLVSLDMPRAICLAISTIAIALYVGDYSNEKNLAKNESRYYLFCNIGWFLGPLITGITVKFFGNESMFILCSLFMGIALLYFTHQHLVAEHPVISQEDDVHDEDFTQLASHIKEYFKDKERLKVFFMAAGMNLSWTSLVYIIIAIKSMGYGMMIVGLISAIRCLPLMLLEPLVGRLADKNGVKSYLVFGFLFSALAMAMFSITSGPIFLCLLCIANIGMAFVEPLQETYFFKVVKKEKQRAKFFGIYNTADPVMHLITPIVASVILSFSSGFSALWLFYSLVMLVFAGIASTIKVK